MMAMAQVGQGSQRQKIVQPARDVPEWAAR